MHVSSTEIRISFFGQLSDIYKNYKAEAKTHSSLEKKIDLYFNQERMKFEVCSEESERMRLIGDNFKILNAEKYIEMIENCGDLSDVDLKTQKHALKALIRLPWNQPIDSKIVESRLSPIVISELHENTELSLMLDHIESFVRSKDGGTGVFYVTCKPFEGKSRYSEEGVVIKLVEIEEGKRVLMADGFLRMLGFCVPRSQCLPRDSTLRPKFNEVIATHLDSIDLKYHTQVSNHLSSTQHTILMMNRLPATSLKQTPKVQLQRLLNDPDLLVKLGKVIFFDAFMGNRDRLSALTCNLGNIMIDSGTNTLNLIDHEYSLNLNSSEAIFSSLCALLDGEDEIEKIIGSLNKSLNLAGIELTPEAIDNLRTNFRLGIQAGLEDLISLFDNPAIYKGIYRDSFLEESDVAYKVVQRLKQYKENYGISDTSYSPSSSSISTHPVLPRVRKKEQCHTH
jgi:hypothetical protein